MESFKGDIKDLDSTGFQAPLKGLSGAVDELPPTNDLGPKARARLGDLPTHMEVQVRKPSFFGACT